MLHRLELAIESGGKTATAVELIEGFTPLQVLGDDLGVWLNEVSERGAGAAASILE
jgi:hypothetical protein